MESGFDTPQIYVILMGYVVMDPPSNTSMEIHISTDPIQFFKSLTSPLFSLRYILPLPF